MSNGFRSYLAPFVRISAYVLIFLLLVKITTASSTTTSSSSQDEEPENPNDPKCKTKNGDNSTENTPSFYDADNSTQFLQNCTDCTDCSNCTPECQEIMRGSSDMDFHHKDNQCAENMLKEYKKAQEQVRKFKDKLDSYAQSIILWALFIPSLCIGIYLISVGHFDWRTLPIIGSNYHPNPTHGIAFWQYHRMKYVVYKSEIPKTSKGNTDPRDSFVLDDASSVGSAESSESRCSEDFLPEEGSEGDDPYPREFAAAAAK